MPNTTIKYVKTNVIGVAILATMTSWLAACGADVEASSEGDDGTTSEAIVGGKPITGNRYRSLVELSFAGTRQAPARTCSGSVIGKPNAAASNLVLTAAHCVVGQTEDEKKVEYFHGKVDPDIATTALNVSTERSFNNADIPFHPYTIKKVHLHPSMGKCGAKGCTAGEIFVKNLHDLAVIELTANVAGANPASIGKVPNAGDKVLLAGFGLNALGEADQTHSYNARAKIVEEKTFRASATPDNWLLTNGPYGCIQGDSGGPVYVDNESKKYNEAKDNVVVGVCSALTTDATGSKLAVDLLSLIDKRWVQNLL